MKLVRTALCTGSTRSCDAYELSVDLRVTAVDIPKWLRPHVVRDVTDEDEYQNVRLAR